MKKRGGFNDLPPDDEDNDLELDPDADLAAGLDAHLKRMDGEQREAGDNLARRHALGAPGVEPSSEDAMNSAGELAARDLAIRAEKLRSREAARIKGRNEAEAFKAWAKTQPELHPKTVHDIIERLKAGLPPYEGGRR